MSIQLPFSKDAKVLEVGGGNDPIFHPAMDIRNIPGKVDIVHNCESIPWPIESASFDGVFAKFLIEHIGWRKVLPVITEMRRVLRPGGLMILIGPNTLEQCKEITRRNRIAIEESALLYGGQEFAEGGDGDQNLHKSAFSPDYMRQLCAQAGFESVDIQQLGNVVTDMVTVAKVGGGGFDAITTAPWFREIEGKMDEPKKMIEVTRLNLGSFTVMHPASEGWVNVDILPLDAYAKEKGYAFKQWDLRKLPLPWPDLSISDIVMSHTLEHLTRAEGAALLRDCRRVLVVGGTIRVAVPDLITMAKAYLDGTIKDWTFNEGVKNSEDRTDAFWQLLTAGHVTAYDWESLVAKMVKAGLSDASLKSAGESSSRAIKATTDMFPELSSYVEAHRPEREAFRPLKIALLSSPMLSSPPKNYGGLEAVCADLAEALAELGHDVTLFAAKGSHAEGCRVVEALEPMGTVHSDWLDAEMRMYEAVKGHLGGFDIIHGMNWFGTEYLYKRDHPEAKVLHTHHGGLSWKSRPFPKMNLIAISDWMVRVYASQGWAARRCYNGVDESRYMFRAEKGERLLFVGRLDSFKQSDVAIAAANKLGMGLDVVGGSFVQDKGYLEQVKALCVGDIKLHLDASQEEKVELYRNAYAVLFPSRMSEPFGLIVPESNLCGTPVIGLRDGAIPETIRDGVNGYVVGEETSNLTDPQAIMARKLRDVDALVEGVRKLKEHPITPESCRAEATRFTRMEMAKAYVEKYESILKGDEW